MVNLSWLLCFFACGVVDGTSGPGGTDASGLVLHDFEALNDRRDPSWGPVLTDLIQHTPEGSVDDWSFPDDLTTWAHETTHAVHSYLRYERAPIGSNAFYLLNDQAAVVVEPPIGKSSVADYVPPVLQGFRFDTYLTDTNWEDSPLYLCDEWVAYNNGASAALALQSAGKFPDDWRDQSGVVEFMTYGIALGMAVEDQTPEFFDQEPQFLALIEHELRRSMELFEEYRTLKEFESDTAEELYSDLQGSQAASEHRRFVVRHFGERFSTKVMGF